MGRELDFSIEGFCSRKYSLPSKLFYIGLLHKAYVSYVFCCKDITFFLYLLSNAGSMNLVVSQLILLYSQIHSWLPPADIQLERLLGSPILPSRSRFSG